MLPKIELMHVFKFFTIEILDESTNETSYILKQTWCLYVWAVPGKFFQSLPVPCGVLCRRGGGGGRAS